MANEQKPSQDLKARFNVDAPTTPKPVDPKPAPSKPAEPKKEKQEITAADIGQMPASVLKSDSPGRSGPGERPPGRTPDPTVQRVSQNKKLKVGDTYVVNFPRRAPVGEAVIKVLTTEPGRYVGVEFNQPIQNGEDCYGKCKPGHGLWAHPEHLLTKEEHQAMVARGEAQQATQPQMVDELEFNSETGEIVVKSPAK